MKARALVRAGAVAALTTLALRAGAVSGQILPPAQAYSTWISAMRGADGACLRDAARLPTRIPIVHRVVATRQVYVAAAFMALGRRLAHDCGGSSYAPAPASYDALLRRLGDEAVRYTNAATDCGRWLTLGSQGNALWTCGLARSFYARLMGDVALANTRYHHRAWRW